MEAKNITESGLIKRGFTKQYAEIKDGFYLLQDVDDKFYFTVDFKTMTMHIHLDGYGCIKKLKNIKTMKDFDILFFALTGSELELKVSQ